jgi:hypothetical protein
VKRCASQDAARVYPLPHDCLTKENFMSAVLTDEKPESIVKPGKISIYQPEQPGLIYPELPEFRTAAEHRQASTTVLPVT